MNVPVHRVLELVEDFREWVRWSPWEELDPHLERAYAGPARGAGTTYQWTGNAKAGAGTMVMTAAEGDGVDIDLTFIKPFPARHKFRIDVTPAGDGSDVVWTMTGQRGRITKGLLSLFGVEKRLGRDIERGLVRLRAMAEQA